MAISIVGTPQTGAKTDGTDVTLTFNPKPSEGDVVVVVGGTFNRSSITPGPVPASSPNYTSIYSYTAGNPMLDVSYKRMGSSPDATVVCKGSGNAADGVVYIAYVFRGVNPNLLDANVSGNAGFATAGPTGSTNPDAPAITTLTANAWAFIAAISSVRDTSIAAPTNYTTNHTATAANASTNDYTLAASCREITAPGSENPASWTTWSTSTWIAVTLGLAPAKEATDPVVIGTATEGGTSEVAGAPVEKEATDPLPLAFDPTTEGRSVAITEIVDTLVGSGAAQTLSVTAYLPDIAESVASEATDPVATACQEVGSIVAVTDVLAASVAVAVVELAFGEGTASQADAAAVATTEAAFGDGTASQSDTSAVAVTEASGLSVDVTASDSLAACVDEAVGGAATGSSADTDAVATLEAVAVVAQVEGSDSLAVSLSDDVFGEATASAFDEDTVASTENASVDTEAVAEVEASDPFGLAVVEACSLSVVVSPADDAAVGASEISVAAAMIDASDASALGMGMEGAEIEAVEPEQYEASDLSCVAADERGDVRALVEAGDALAVGSAESVDPGPQDLVGRDEIAPQLQEVLTLVNRISARDSTAIRDTWFERAFLDVGSAVKDGYEFVGVRVREAAETFVTFGPAVLYGADLARMGMTEGAEVAISDFTAKDIDSAHWNDYAVEYFQPTVVRTGRRSKPVDWRK